MSAAMFMAALAFGPSMPLLVTEVRAQELGTVRINEFVSAGSPEWVELYNASDTDISFAGWQLIQHTGSDLAGTSAFAALPDLIEAGGYAVVEGKGHKLNNDGDIIKLLDANQVTFDSIAYGVATSSVVAAPASGESAAFIDGAWQISMAPTKGSANRLTPPLIVNEATSDEYVDLNTAVSEANEDDTLILEAGTFLPSEQISPKEGMTIRGAGEGETVVDISEFNGHGFAIDVDDVTLESFTIQGDASTNQKSSIHAFSTSGISGLAIRNLSIKDSYQTGIDLRGVTATSSPNLLANITVTGTENGFGLTFSSAQDVTVRNVTTSGNAWGDVGIYPSNGFTDRETGGLVFEGDVNLSDGAGAITIQPGGLGEDELISYSTADSDDALYDETAAVTVPASFNRVVYALRDSDDLHNFILTPQPALSGVMQTLANADLFSDFSITNLETGNVVVTPEIGLQEAIDAAVASSTLEVESGTYGGFSLQKYLTIEAADGADVTVAASEGLGSSQRVIDMRDDGLGDDIGPTLRGITVDATGESQITVGVSVTADHAAVQDITVVGDEQVTGIQTTSDSEGVSVLDNTITNPNVGVSLRGDDDTARGNTITNAVLEGIGVDSLTHALENNSVTATSTAPGLRFYTVEAGQDLLGILFGANDDLKSIDNGSGTTYRRISIDDTYFPSIQTAIASSTLGDTITIGSDTYDESLYINNSLTLVGDGPTPPVITGFNSGENFIIKIEDAINVMLDGIEINGGGSERGDNAFDYGIQVARSGTEASPVTIKNATVKNIWKTEGNGIDASNNSYVVGHDNNISSFHKRGIRFTDSDGVFYDNEVVGDNVNGTDRVQSLVNLRGGSDVEIYDNILHNALTEEGEIPTWDSPTIFVSSYGGSSPSSANIHDNKIYNSGSGVVLGSVYVGDGTDNSTARIVDNTFRNLKWAINLEREDVTVSALTGNKFSNVEEAVSAVVINDEPLENPPLIAAPRNWWGTTASSTIAALVIDTVTFEPWYVNSKLDALSSDISGDTLEPSESGDLALDAEGEGNIKLPDGVTGVTLADDAKLDLSAGIKSSGGKKRVTLDSGDPSSAPIVLKNTSLTTASISIPVATEISGSDSWDGKIQPPKVATADGTAPAGFSVGPTVISVGSDSETLTFDKSVTLLLSGTTGTVGYKPAGSDAWVQITEECGGSYDNPDDPEDDDGECFINNGVDTKIVTYHFTEFGSLAQVSDDGGSSGGGGGGSSGSSRTSEAAPTTPAGSSEELAAINSALNAVEIAALQLQETLSAAPNVLNEAGVGIEETESGVEGEGEERAADVASETTTPSPNLQQAAVGTILDNWIPLTLLTLLLAAVVIGGGYYLQRRRSISKK